ncbi:Protein adenylyltransferase SelO [Hyphomicrobiales bacterium]|nr:Protein adenylyltransferase SelO [Hyphomicrobiales bacterium]CAH1701546.1 Protein adenylyltransferase SelO [Hyphomicrobiales bacterium]CAI0345721.1 Protein adenylyltransferase SelO [Hyphomicrobiales bacterium]
MTAIAFDNSYARLPERFYAVVNPTAVAAPRLVKLNEALARQLGLDADWLKGADGIAMLAGNRLVDGALPIATAYAGHQFGGFSPQLGDGRAILLGEVVGRDGERRDIQLKGAGPTPFSRRGDGRAALGPVLREYIVSEAMAALGVPTTRSLAAVLTGESVRRETLLPGAVLTRVAASHIRIGTFQFFAARRDAEALRLLADHVIARHYPEAARSEAPPLALLEAVVAAQADLVARWMLIGFIHGVMNTDNMSIAGETIDYGPCAFMDSYDPATVFSSIDEQGRYAYGNQPPIALWNLTRLAEALLPLLAEDQDQAVALAQEAVNRFNGLFQGHLIDGFRRKLGLATEAPDDVLLVKALLDAMQRGQADFTLVFRRLSDDAGHAPEAGTCRDLFADPAAFDDWHRRWRDRLAAESLSPEERQRRMRAVNPLYIPRNHRVEAVIEAAVERNDLAPFEELLTVLARPFEEQPGRELYTQPPAMHERVLATFCGT